MKRLTREWLKKAEADYRAARILARNKPPLRDEVCFHCQQAVEKFLKALLQEVGLPIPRTHDIGDLAGHLAGQLAFVRTNRRPLAALTRFAVDYRYPGSDATPRQVKTSLQKTGKFRAAVWNHFGLKSN